MELFAATSFGRIATRRTSETDAFQRRGCELPVDLLGPCGAFTESCRPLTFSSSPTGTPESKSFSPDVLSIYRHVDIAAYRDRSGFDRLVRGPGFASAVSRRGGPKPENAFRRVQNLRAFTRRRRIDPILFRPSQRFRTVSPSTHPRPYVRQATDFLLASALFEPPSDF